MLPPPSAFIRKRRPKINLSSVKKFLFWIKTLALQRKPLIFIPDFKSYNYTPTMSSVHNATEHSYVKEQSKGCSFTISMGRSAPVEQLPGRSLSFTRPCRQDTQSPHPGGCPAPRYPGIPLPPASVSAISKCHFSPKWNIVFYWMAYRRYTALYTNLLVGLKPVKP